MIHNAQPFQPAGASYSPGGWVALAAGRQWLLLRLVPTDPMMQQCWAAMSAGGSVEELLDPLFATGLATTPDFALFTMGDSGCRVVLRGMAQLRYDSTIRTAGTSLLLDLRLDDIPAEAEVLLTGGDDADTSLQLPLSAGVSMASSIRLVTSEKSVTHAANSAPVTVPAESPAQGEAPAVQAGPAVEAAPTTSAPTTEPEPRTRAASTTPAPTTEPEPALDAAPEAEVAPFGEFDHLFAATVHPSDLRQLREELEAEANGEPVEAEQADNEPDGNQPVEPAPPPMAAPGATVGQPPAKFHTQKWATRPPYQDAGLIDSVPWMTDESESDASSSAAAPVIAQPLIEKPAPPPATTPSVQASAGQQGTSVTERAPQLTVKRSSLSVAAGVPMVTAAFCPDHHPNPPHAAHCRNCGRPVAEQEPVEIARPVLGILRLSTGEAVSLDRGVLIGREPGEPDPTGIDRPHVLALPEDLQVSRNHLEVSIDGWRVHVADLGSTNGTFVTPPRQPTMRLNERDPQLIEPGTEVRLSDDFSFSYEVGP